MHTMNSSLVCSVFSYSENQFALGSLAVDDVVVDLGSLLHVVLLQQDSSDQKYNKSSRNSLR